MDLCCVLLVTSCGGYAGNKGHGVLLPLSVSALRALVLNPVGRTLSHPSALSEGCFRLELHQEFPQAAPLTLLQVCSFRVMDFMGTKWFSSISCWTKLGSGSVSVVVPPPSALCRNKARTAPPLWVLCVVCNVPFSATEAQKFPCASAVVQDGLLALRSRPPRGRGSSGPACCRERKRTSRGFALTLRLSAGKQGLELWKRSCGLQMTALFLRMDFTDFIFPGCLSQGQQKAGSDYTAKEFSVFHTSASRQVL